ncbi:DsrE/DsrF/DrsH-like family protein [Candidatus Bathyarchaeota archaeon]|nr:DsrE/DsrF/DrsH-like family protein [Candidatus Bathyarchaeota archaeon]MBL7080420.1 DsrE/DsrF/DrsH-like family protein [Candidatus Bathyarchaeota archaeon]
MSEKKKMAIIVHSGTLDKLYPVFMLASAGGAMDVDAHLFFTFWGLDALKKGGLDSAKLPGVMRVGTGMMKGRIKDANVPTLPALLDMCNELGNIKIYACSTTMELMKVKEEELIPEVDDIVGAAAFLDIAMDADVQLFI